MGAYVKYVSLNYEQLIHEMKLKIFYERVVTDSGSRSDGVQESDESADESAEYTADKDNNPSPQQIMMQKFNGIEISEQDYIDKYQELEKAYWDI